MRPVLPLILCAALAMPAISAPAAPAPPARRPSAFQQLFPKPTGQNGYEELVRAGDRLRDVKLWPEAEIKGAAAPLVLKQQVLADRAAQEVLVLLRRGLAKPVSSPRARADFFPEYARFRSLARFLGMRQCVLMAEGRTAEGVENLALGIRFARVIQQDNLISGLVGIAITAIAVQGIAPYLDQLSARDCEALYNACIARLQERSALPRILEGERRTWKGILAQLRGDLEKNGVRSFSEFVNSHLPDDEPGDGDAGEDAAETAALRQLTGEIKARYGGSPAGVASFYNELEGQLGRQLDRLIVEARKPPWEASPQVESDGSLAGDLASEMLSTMERVSPAFAREETYVRLLAVHCAVLRYRWEHDRVPATLDALNLGELALDPLSGQPLQYRPLGTRRYHLSSVGLPASEDDPRAVDGRRPIILGPGD